MPAGTRHGRVPSLASLGLEQEVTEPARGGESAGLARLAGFLDGAVRDYDSRRDQAGADASSRLSPYLRFGCLSPRAVEDQLPSGKSAGAGAGSVGASCAGATSTSTSWCTTRRTPGRSTRPATAAR